MNIFHWKKYAKYIMNVHKNHVPDKTLLSIERNLHYFYEIVFDVEEQLLVHHQYEVLKEYNPIILRLAYGLERYQMLEQKLLRECSCTHNKRFVLVVMRRQVGKTELKVRVALGCLYAFPQMDTTKDKQTKYTFMAQNIPRARSNLTRLKQKLKTYRSRESPRLSFMENYTIYNISDKLRITSRDNHSDYREIVLQATGKGGRGGTKPWLFADEFFFIPRKTIDEAILPQTIHKGALAFMFTTLERLGHWSRTWLLSTDKEPIHVINRSEICTACMEDDSIVEKRMCTHVPKLETPWVNEDTRKGLTFYMSAIDAAKELYNYLPDTTTHMWREKNLRKDLLRMYPNPTIKIREFYAFVDPSMTSINGSETAIVIVGVHHLHHIICYMRSALTPTVRNIETFVETSLIQFIRNFDHLSTNFRVLLFVESNVTNHAQDLHEIFERSVTLGKWIYVVKGTRGKNKSLKYFDRFGVRKGKGYDKHFANIVNRKMLHQTIYLHPHWLTHYRGNEVLAINTTSFEKAKTDVINKFIQQCAQVKRVAAHNTYIVVSKENMNGQKSNDDLYIAFASVLFWIEKIKNPSNMNLCDQYHRVFSS